MAVTRELTKKYEEFIRGSISEVIEWANEDQIRGEFCLVVEEVKQRNQMRKHNGGKPSPRKNMSSITSRKALLLKKLLKATVDRNVPKREVYDAYHIQQ